MQALGVNGSADAPSCGLSVLQRSCRYESGFQRIEEVFWNWKFFSPPMHFCHSHSSDADSYRSVSFLKQAVSGLVFLTIRILPSIRSQAPLRLTGAVKVGEAAREAGHAP
jgi:hypothetical protein